MNTVPVVHWSFRATIKDTDVCRILREVAARGGTACLIKLPLRDGGHVEHLFLDPNGPDYDRMGSFAINQVPDERLFVRHDGHLECAPAHTMPPKTYAKYWQWFNGSIGSNYVQVFLNRLYERRAAAEKKRRVTVQVL